MLKSVLKTSFVIRELQIKATMGYQYTPTRMTKIKKDDDT